MRLKRLVAISMITACILLAIILLVGLFVPASVLNRIGHKTATSKATETTDGKQVVQTVNPATGETTVTTTDPATGQTTTTTTPASNTPGTTQNTSSSSNNNGGSTPPPPTGGGGTQTPSKPVVTISVSPSTITSGSSATLGWSASNSPISCTASVGWSGTKAASGTQSVNPSSTTTYTLSCTNAGGSDAKSATLTVNAPAPGCGQPGGTCHLADIQGHNTSSDCRSAINVSGAGVSAYAIPSSFLTLHQPNKTITNTLCGKVYSSNLSNFTGEHHNGSTLGGKNYATWTNNFYLGPYN